MRPIVLTRSGTTGTSTVGVLDTYRSPFNVGIGIKVSGTATCKIQHTFDNVLTADPSAAVWYDHPVLTSITADADGNYAFPITAVRVNMTAGTGTVTATFIQAGMPGD
jgi:hypothetical protein